MSLEIATMADFTWNRHYGLERSIAQNLYYSILYLGIVQIVIILLFSKNALAEVPFRGLKTF